MNTRFKVFASYNILQYLWFYPCSYICNCLKMPKKSQINEYSDTLSPCCQRPIWTCSRTVTTSHLDLQSGIPRPPPNRKVSPSDSLIDPFMYELMELTVDPCFTAWMVKQRNREQWNRWFISTTSDNNSLRVLSQISHCPLLYRFLVQSPLQSARPGKSRFLL
jgi:hypothetical protein